MNLFVSGLSTRLALITMAILAHVSKTAELSTYNCNTLVTSEGKKDNRTFALGESLTLCVHFLPQDVKIGFKVTVDVYEALTMRRTFEALNNTNTDLMFQASNSWTLSQQYVI